MQTQIADVALSPAYADSCPITDYNITTKTSPIKNYVTLWICPCSILIISIYIFEKKNSN